MRLLFIGDVVGSLGRNTVSDYLPKLKKKYRPQVTIVNGENAASGRGITEKIYKKFLQDGPKKSPAIPMIYNHVVSTHAVPVRAAWKSLFGWPPA